MAISLFRELKRRSGFAKSEFEAICDTAGLNLEFSYNRYGVSVLRDIFVNREYSDFFPFYEKSLIVDVGAHFGYFTLFAAKNSAEDSRIIAIEPATENYKVLCKNIAACRLSNVTTLNMALSETQGVRDLFRSKSPNYSLFSKDFNILSSHESEKVESITLLNLLQKFSLHHIDFLKMDCEGAEYPIILNSDTDLLGTIHTISMEFHDLKRPEFTGNILAERLEKCGFKIVKFGYLPTKLNLNYGKLVATKGFTQTK